MMTDKTPFDAGHESWWRGPGWYSFDMEASAAAPLALWCRSEADVLLAAPRAGELHSDSVYVRGPESSLPRVLTVLFRGAHLYPAGYFDVLDDGGRDLSDEWWEALLAVRYVMYLMGGDHGDCEGFLALVDSYADADPSMAALRGDGFSLGIAMPVAKYASGLDADGRSFLAGVLRAVALEGADPDGR